MIQSLTTDDLIQLIGQKEATLLLISRQAQEIIAENERLKAELAVLKLALEKATTNGTDGRQASDSPLPAEAPAGTATS